MPMTKAEMKAQLEEARASAESLKQEVNRLTMEKDALAARVVEVTELRATVEELRREAQGDATGDLEDQLAETRWRLEESERESEVAVLRAKETTREELQQTHKQELESRNYLIQLLREKVEQLQQQVETSGEGAHRRPSAMRLSETLTKFSGEDVDDEGAFLRWLRKLERIAELYEWSDGEKLIQFELLLTGRAEKLYELLPAGNRVSYQEATEALKKRLIPAGREALRSAQLMRRRQQANESVDSFAQDFERLFDSSYGQRQGMDEASSSMLKRDLFIQGLLLKWQEKVLPSAETYTDALHQARIMEEQSKQLAKMHPGQRNPVHPAKKPPDQSDSNQSQRPNTHNKEQHKPKCHKCGSTRHFIKDCPMKKATTETPGRREQHFSNNISGQYRNDEGECEKLHQQWVEAELSRMKNALQVDTVTGAVGPLYYCEAEIEGQPVEALIDSGSSATVMTFSLFRRIARGANLSVDILEKPDVVLRDYNQNPLRIGAVAKLEVKYEGKVVLTPVYINADSENRNIESCIFGTNLLFSLGILSVSEGVKVRGEEAGLAGRREVVTAAVKLVKKGRIPARSGAILHLTVDFAEDSGGSFYFQPCESHQLIMEEAIVNVEKGQLKLPVINLSDEALVLEEGKELGIVTEVRSDDKDELCVDIEGKGGGAITKLDIGEFKTLTDDERREKLKDLLTKEGVRVPGEILGCALEYHSVFSLEEMEKGTVEGVEHTIDTGDSRPIKEAARRVPFALREKISKMVKEMLDGGVVSASASPWASPVVVVKKKDGSLRFCVDYRRLNAITKKDVFPLPRIDDLLDQLQGKCVFSTFDARRGYWQIPVGGESKQKTAFITHEGLFEFNVMPFGLCNAPATFQRLMQQILTGLGSFCNVYIDDILIFSRNLEEHRVHLRKVFERLKEYSLKLHPQKCQLALPEVEYLGHIISAEGVRPNSNKIDAVKQFPIPTCVRAVRGFIGLCSYYRKFVPGFAKIASPLHQLLRKEVPFVWTEACQQSFQKLQDLLTSPPVLVYPDFSKPFVLHTDASGEGLGAVVEQIQDDGTSHPIAYASRTVSPHERRYGITELEALGVVWALKHFRAYIWGHKTTVYTDHSPVRSLLYAKHSSGKLARWSQAVSEYDLEIRYRPGRQNANADALSRSPLQAKMGSSPTETFQIATIATSDEEKEYAKLQQEDPELQQILISLDGKEKPDNFVLVSDILYYCGSKEGGPLRLCVPLTKREQLLKSAHSGNFAGHFSGRAIYNSLAKKYWWKGMYWDTLSHCRGCLTCASFDGAGRRMKPPLMPIPVGGPFHRVGVDIMELPLTLHGNKYVIVFMDYLTKWVEAFPAADQTSETIATLLVNEIICRHGVPDQLLSDRGTNLLSGLMKDVYALMGIEKINTTASHPQTDGLVENMNRTLRAMIAKYSSLHGDNWDEYLPKLLFAYRTKYHESTKESPFFLLYGRDARVPGDETLSHRRSPYMVDIDDYKSELMISLAEAWDIAWSSISKAQKAQKKQRDKEVRVKPIRVGDRVMVYMPHEATGKIRKLAHPHFGPYRVVEIHPNGVTVKPVDKPRDATIRVNLDRVTLCPDELSDTSWLGKRRSRK